jgi:anthraniloyl-CoA monooxygenase
VKIKIVGAGPAGLYFALLMKQLDCDHDITIFERDGPDDTYGWGIVFSDKTLSYLRDNDQKSYEDITNSFETWDNVDVVHRDAKISIHGNKFSGIARVRFLNILQQRCNELGVNIVFHTNIPAIEGIKDYDLLVGADGANSVVRRHHSEHFSPKLDTRKNKYIWLGTERLFHGLTLTFRENEHGVFAAHSYKFNKKYSTFIVECVGNSWENAGLGSMSEAGICSYLAKVFARDLQGYPLLTNNFVRWLNFVIVKNDRWFFDNVVLLGDALHTAHFSIGSGTKLAVEDSIALAQCFRTYPDPSKALPEFQRVRKPIVDDLQEAAHSSLVWFENADGKMHLDPLPFAFELMTRSHRIDHDNLRKRDPEFVASYEQWQAAHA